MPRRRARPRRRRGGSRASSRARRVGTAVLRDDATQSVVVRAVEVDTARDTVRVLVERQAHEPVAAARVDADRHPARRGVRHDLVVTTPAPGLAVRRIRHDGEVVLQALPPLRELAPPVPDGLLHKPLEAGVRGTPTPQPPHGHAPRFVVARARHDGVAVLVAEQGVEEAVAVARAPSGPQPQRHQRGGDVEVVGVVRRTEASPELAVVVQEAVQQAAETQGVIIRSRAGTATDQEVAITHPRRWRRRVTKSQLRLGHQVLQLADHVQRVVAGELVQALAREVGHMRCREPGRHGVVVGDVAPRVAVADHPIVHAEGLLEALDLVFHLLLEQPRLGREPPAAREEAGVVVEEVGHDLLVDLLSARGVHVEDLRRSDRAEVLHQLEVQVEVPLRGRRRLPQATVDVGAVLEQRADPPLHERDLPRADAVVPAGGRRRHVADGRAEGAVVEVHQGHERRVPPVRVVQLREVGVLERGLEDLRGSVTRRERARDAVLEDDVEGVRAILDQPRQVVRPVVVEVDHLPVPRLRRRVLPRVHEPLHDVGRRLLFRLGRLGRLLSLLAHRVELSGFALFHQALRFLAIRQLPSLALHDDPGDLSHTRALDW